MSFAIAEPLASGDTLNEALWVVNTTVDAVVIRQGLKVVRLNFFLVGLANPTGAEAFVGLV